MARIRLDVYRVLNARARIPTDATLRQTSSLSTSTRGIKGHCLKWNSSTDSCLNGKKLSLLATFSVHIVVVVVAQLIIE